MLWKVSTEGEVLTVEIRRCVKPTKSCCNVGKMLWLHRHLHFWNPTRPGRAARRRRPVSSRLSAGTTSCCLTRRPARRPLPALCSGTRALPTPCCATRPSPSAGRRRKRGIGIAGRWRGCPGGPRRGWRQPGSASLRTPAGVARAPAYKAVTDCALAHRRARPPQTEKVIPML